MAARKTHKMMRAKEPFTYGDGYHVVHKDELLSSDHDAVKARPDAFEETDYVREAEQATAAPGEKRGA